MVARVRIRLPPGQKADSRHEPPQARHRTPGNPKPEIWKPRDPSPVNASRTYSQKVFEGLTERLGSAFSALRAKGRLSSGDVDEALREVRLALLEADVHVGV